MNSMDDKGSWSGCVVLFVRSCSLDLLSLYRDQHSKFPLFKTIKLTLSDAVGGLEGYEILKLHDAEPDLGVELKFKAEPPCGRFLESYACGALTQALSQHASRLLIQLPDDGVAMEMQPDDGVVVETQLKAGTHTLDEYLYDLDFCLGCIHLSQPVRLRDDEVSQLEEQLQSSYAPPTQPRQEVPSNSFLFQRRVFDDRSLTPADQQRFAAQVGRDWKRVGRSLAKGCPALKGPAIDNLAYEYEREGLYEQAYQLLARFIQSEGRKARLSRLVRALEENKLTHLAEIMLE